MRITSQTLASSPTYINPEGQYTLLLRNLQIPFIENLGITNDKFQVIDITNNDITVLDNVPDLRNLHTLLAANNNICSVNLELSNLKTLSLMNNNILRLLDLFPLHKLRLEHLVVLTNPVSSHEHLRAFLVWLLPSLKTLDFSQVKPKEKESANELLGLIESPTQLARELLKGSEQTEVKEQTKEQRQLNNTVRKLSEEDREKLLKELENATSIDEIERIEAQLRG